MRRIREELETQIDTVKQKTIEFICNPFNKSQINFINDALNNPFLDLRYMSHEFVSFNQPFIFAYIETGRIPKVFFADTDNYGDESPETLSHDKEVIVPQIKQARLTKEKDEFVCDFIKSKNENVLRDIVEREKLLYE